MLNLPVKRALWLNVYNCQVADSEYKQYCDVFCQTYLKNMKKYNEDDMNYRVMCRLRQYLVKLGNYAMRLTSVVLKENNSDLQT